MICDTRTSSCQAGDHRRAITAENRRILNFSSITCYHIICDNHVICPLALLFLILIWYIIPGTYITWYIRYWYRPLLILLRSRLITTNCYNCSSMIWRWRAVDARLCVYVLVLHAYGMLFFYWTILLVVADTAINAVAVRMIHYCCCFSCSAACWSSLSRYFREKNSVPPVGGTQCVPPDCYI